MNHFAPRRPEPTPTPWPSRSWKADDPGAVAAFVALVGARPDDPLAQYHLRRLLDGGRGVRLDVA